MINNKYEKWCLQKTVQFRSSAQCAHFKCVLMVCERLRSYKRDQNIETCMWLGQVTKQNIFTQTIADKIYEIMS